MTITPQPLTEQQVARLKRIRNRTMRRELAAINGDRKILVYYDSKMSRRGILASLEVRVDALVKLTGNNGVTCAARAADGRWIGDWSIRFAKAHRESMTAATISRRFSGCA